MGEKKPLEPEQEDAKAGALTKKNPKAVKTQKRGRKTSYNKVGKGDNKEIDEER